MHPVFTKIIDKPFKESGFCCHSCQTGHSRGRGGRKRDDQAKSQKVKDELKE